MSDCELLGRYKYKNYALPLFNKFVYFKPLQNNHNTNDNVNQMTLVKSFIIYQIYVLSHSMYLTVIECKYMVTDFRKRLSV